MKPVKVWQKAHILGEVRVGTYYISKGISLKTDKNLRTIWLDLKSEVFLKDKVSGALNFPVLRKSYGTSRDFKLDINDNVYKILEVFKWNFKLSIEAICDLIQKYHSLSEENIRDYLEKNLENFSEADFSNFFEILNLVKSIEKVEMNTLISDSRYTLLFGNLSEEENFSNLSETEYIIFEKPKITKNDFFECFSGIIIDPQLILETFNSTNIPSILNGEMPKNGGVILVDHGGTGKSLMKSAYIKFWKKLNGEIKEKDQGDISSYINAAPQLIKTWYRGGVMQGMETTTTPEIDLVQAARNNKVPSLLIIDEAEDFIRVDRGMASRTPIQGSTLALKRFIQDYSKGGVSGYVVTLILANIDRDEIEEALQQGSERLKVIYYGPPKREEEWMKLIEIGFKNLNLGNDFNEKKILADLLLYHNSIVSHEIYGISPRTFLAFCSDYYFNFSSSGERVSSLEEVYAKVSLGSKQNNWKINFEDFMQNFISRELINNLNRDNTIQNKNEIINKYYSFLKSNKGNFGSDISNNIVEEVNNTIIFLNSNLHSLKKVNDFNVDKDNLRRKYLDSLSFLYNNLEEYFFEKEGKKWKVSYLQKGFEVCFRILGKWSGRTDLRSIDQREFEFVQNFILNLKKITNE